MKPFFIKIAILFFFTNAFCQKTNLEKVTIENQEINYLFFSSKSNSNTFQIIIYDNDSVNCNIRKKLKNCLKRKSNIGNIYFVVIPENIKFGKEKFVLELISDILSKRKLIDKEMNIIMNKDYLNVYEETRKQNNGKYKNSFLNKVNKVKIIESIENICDLID